MNFQYFNHAFKLSVVLILVLLFAYILLKIRKNRAINIRDASLTVEELEDHARRTALEHSVTPKRNILNWPIPRMNDNYNLIFSVYKSLNEDIQQKRAVPAAAEWLLDNFYVIEEQVKSIRRDMQKKSFYQLPVLKSGPFTGQTRVFAIAMELVSHLDGHIEESILLKYLKAYQTNSILFDREICVIPTMIKLALIEKTRDICQKIKETRRQWQMADEIIENSWSNKEINIYLVNKTSEDSISNKHMNIEKIIEQFEIKIGAMDEVNPSFVEHLFFRLRRSGHKYTNVLRYIDEYLDKYGTTTENIAQKEHNLHAVSTVSMGNCIISLKYVSNLNWVDLFESTSFVEQILRQDPDGTYPLMDISSKNYYRRQIENIAKVFRVSEIHIAKEAIALAKEAFLQVKSSKDSDVKSNRKAHVGYYLIGKGLTTLENKQKGKIKPQAKIEKFVKKHPGILYLGSISAISLALAMIAINYSINNVKSYTLVIALLSVISILIPVTEIAVTLVNWLICRIQKPEVFVRYELKNGIPDELSTMVVIPALLTDVRRVEDLLENMENHYLSNNEQNLYFALLGAFKDSDNNINSDDEKVQNKAFSGIHALNKKYSVDGKDIFYFYNRLRKFNECDNNWTGWERKRGALMEFNNMLLGGKDTSFSFFSNVALPDKNIKYVITIDADTILPMGMAKKMIATMAHPLYIPEVDIEKGLVIEGYGIMQPRISFDMDSSNRSIFSRIYTGQEGIDPYASAISDVYQDLFKEGIFTGKGIYDLKVFEIVLKDAVPENSILSHDLLEGSYVRTALVNDLELIDSYPSKYNSFVARMYRWIRGDWQLIPWLSRKVYDRKNNLIKNPLSYISIWKILDNLRRSLVAPAIVILILLGFSVLPGSSLFWTSLGLITLSVPFVLSFLTQVFSGQLMLSPIKRHIPGFFGLKATLFQFMLSFVFLPHQAFMAIDAIAVTLIRVFITKKNMLEWVTSADQEKNQDNSLKNYLSTMRISIMYGLVVFILAWNSKPDSLVLSLILLLIWGIAPFIAFNTSKDSKNDKVKPSPAEQLELRLIARKTWRYFEEFANFKNNYLIPDNYQESPARGISYRTSPTNIGLGLLSILSARDFGYIGILEMTEDIIKTVTTIEKMEKWNGHLYNWYDTRSLEPLRPIYVSTVDSGNLVCYLITLSQGLKDYMNRPIVDLKFVSGIKDTLRNWHSDSTSNLPEFVCLDNIQTLNTINPDLWFKTLNTVIENSGTINELSGISNIKNQVWKLKMERMSKLFKKELLEFAPWISLIQDIPEKLLQETFAEQMNKLIETVKHNFSLNDLHSFNQKILALIDRLTHTVSNMGKENLDNELIWLGRLRDTIRDSDEFAKKFIENYNNLINRIDLLAAATKFAVLYDERRQLFSIGYNIEESKLTNSYYDLLASEARQTSYIAIARGEVPPKHWFMLGRSLTVVDSYKGLVSWSGTMFEYLMPLLLMKSYRNSLLDETYSFVIKSQMKYARQRKMPWGTSESAFNLLDINLDYQYKAIGVPWLGLKRGLIDDAVASPYSTFLALLVDPFEAIKNIKLLKEQGLEGPYGYYEAADYTPERLATDSKCTIIKSFMAHHQGMTLLALDNFLNGDIMQKRFFMDPFVKAARLLLQEKVPQNVVFTKEAKEKIMPFKGTFHFNKNSVRKFSEPNKDLPVAHILSNGNYSVMLSDKGTGYSRNKIMAVSRWREDAIIDKYGMFFYIRNVDTNSNWSATYAPLNISPDNYEVIFTPDKASFKRTDKDIETTTEIIVTSNDNAEIRRVTLKNNGNSPCVLDLTSYFEIVLTTDNADQAHMAFSNLFVKTEYNCETKSLIACRRPRSESDKESWISLTALVEGEIIGDLQYETDRMQFIGRGRTVKNPIVIEGEKPLSNTIGPVLDPVFSLRARVRIAPTKTSRIAFVVTTAHSKEVLMELIDKYSSIEICNVAFWLALTRSQVETKYLNIKSSEMALYQEIISHILFISPLRQKYSSLISQNIKGQPSLWSYGISGDRAIILVIINKIEEVDILYEVLKAHEYWRLKDLNVDLVVLSNDENSYTNSLFTLIKEIEYSSQTHDMLNRHGDVFIINTNNIPKDEINLFCDAARIIFRGDSGTMEEQIKFKQNNSLPNKRKFLLNSSEYHLTATKEIELVYPNGLGGFATDCNEYIISLTKGQMTPAPWINVIANPNFGFIVTESGGGYTWCENSRENKLSPWSNDPVSDNPSEVFYLGNEFGELWSLTPLPIRDDEVYTISHGFGYSKFEHVSNGISQSLTQFVPVEDTVKVSIIKLKNITENVRNLTLTYYVSPVLGINPKDTAMHIKTSQTDTGTLIIQNPYNKDFDGRISFIDTSIKNSSVTGDRKEFLGIGNFESPEGLQYEHLSGNVGSGYDPCGAMQVNIKIEPNETCDVVFLFGMGNNILNVSDLIDKYNSTEMANESLMKVKNFWKEKLTMVQVNTPDQSMNIMLNGWLLYQVVSCRLWARTSFYQAGGAFGFRDQLQDCLAVAHIWPDVAKNQILKHAKHQFPEGDVLHWWHEPQQKGTRTRISDDYLWLPYITAEYIKITGDYDILNIELPFMETDILKDFEDEKYCMPHPSVNTSTLYNHCIRSIERALKFGEHGLPLIGLGDWNDGMNAIGNKGKGESVWLGWFLCATIKSFAELCQKFGQVETANRYINISENVASSIEEHAWDGNWYKRAFFDNGKPLGSASNSECKIDSLAQTWAIISKAGNITRAKRAMSSLEDYLISHEDGLIKLLAPPFNDGDLEPGYIKAYVPGVRENGGQYTHAAAWVIGAFAMLGDGDKAWELFGLINPINHTRTNREYSIYKVEPYVMSADVYGEHPHIGRGGWTWYTGSASWMYRVGLENILGFKKNGDTLVIDPCIPSKWTEFSIIYKYFNTSYNLKFNNPEGLNNGSMYITVDGISIDGNIIKLEDTNAICNINIQIRKAI